jgi:hypothetical protein
MQSVAIESADHGGAAAPAATHHAHEREHGLLVNIDQPLDPDLYLPHASRKAPAQRRTSSIPSRGPASGRCE